MAGLIRQPIDLASLERYLSHNVYEVKTPVDLKQFGYGQSNPTYQLVDHVGKKFVMRKKPPGQLLSKTAHQVEREYRIIHALEATDVPVPKAYGLCEDSAVIGTPFYIMEFLDGRIFEDPSLPGVSAQERTDMWRSAVQTLAILHRVSPCSLDMSDFGKPIGFYNRQLKTFHSIQNVQASTLDKDTGEPVGMIPHFQEMISFFSDSETQPEDRSTFVHGDYKIDNLVFHKTEPIVIGILDWEMATIGHPLADIVNLLSPYTIAAIPQAVDGGYANSLFDPGILDGLPTREQIMKWYRDIAGWDPRPIIGWGDAFGLLKGTIIMQGIAARYAMRVASSARAREYAAQMKPFAEIGWIMVSQFQEKLTKPPKANL